jgi:hypothetical protein
MFFTCRSQWPHGLRRRSLAGRLLGLRVRIKAGAWMSVSCECCVLQVGLFVGLITRPEESYQVWCVWVWSWSLDNEEALALWGLLRHGMECNVLQVHIFVRFTAPHTTWNFWKLTEFFKLFKQDAECMIAGFRRDADEICALLGYYAALIGSPVPTFRDNISVPSLRVKKSKTKAFFSDFLTLENGPIYCLETSVQNYRSTLRLIPEGRRSQDWKCTCNVILWRVHVTFVAREKHQCVILCCDAWQWHNTVRPFWIVALHVDNILFFWRFYGACNKTWAGVRVKCPIFLSDFNQIRVCLDEF